MKIDKFLKNLEKLRRRTAAVEALIKRRERLHLVGLFEGRYQIYAEKAAPLRQYN